MPDNKSENKNSGEVNRDSNFDELLIQVFGSKENAKIEHDRQKLLDEQKAKVNAENKQSENKKSPEPKPSAESENKKTKTVHKASKAGNSKPRSKAADSAHKNADKKPVKPKSAKEDTTLRFEKNVNEKSKQTAKNPAVKPVNKKTDAKDGDKHKKEKLSEKIAKLPKGKKAAAIAGIVLAVILILFLFIYGLYSFYYSLFGKYHGDTNWNKYGYNSSDYVDDPSALSPEDAEAALKKQLEDAAIDPMSDKDVMNILLIGEDLRDTQEQSRGNTDVMMMISINKKLKTITMTSFLRDAWVEIGDHGMDKLNAAYWYDGPELVKSTIQKYYGVVIDRYVIVNFSTFIEIVDTIGGINMDVTDEEAEGMKAPMAEQNNLMHKKKGTDYLKKGGKQLKLNGNQALAFARLRYVGNADYERTQRQRRVIAEIIKEAKKMSLVEINTFAQKIFPEVKLDITKGELASLLLNAYDYMSYDIQQLQVPADGAFEEGSVQVQSGGEWLALSVLFPDFQKNAEIIKDKIYVDHRNNSSSSADNSNTSSGSAGENDTNDNTQAATQ
ncbi:MAG: LCP family protein [Oscillospiraceae bacterium]